MTNEQEEEMFKFMGKIDERTKNILDRLDNLPCGRDDKRISSLENWKSDLRGQMKGSAMVFGSIGSVIILVIKYFLDNR